MVLACGEHDRTHLPAIEPAIARSLGDHFGAPVTATCAWIGAIAVGCRATFRDGAALEIAVDGRQWRVVGRVFATAPLVAYVRAELAELGRTDTIACGPIVHAGERLACALSAGGTAFLDVGADGEAAIELALDPAVAAVRAEVPRDRELVRMSRALDIAGQDE